jgi:hypothetical protein
MGQQLESLKPTLTKRQIIDSKYRYILILIDFYFRSKFIIKNR